ncbi:MAG TPA: hypothetical protein VK483_15515 [Chitinophagaceae bacterium]|nr:hypothetical protein [Chitinophagaceae bacterium]
MNPQNINQEILLFIGTSFANRKLCDTENKEARSITTHEKLENACWDGLLGELLPDLAGATRSKAEGIIWKIITADNFLCINMGAYNKPVMGESSIDPYCFITSLNIN